jgi:hypothetical protein
MAKKLSLRPAVKSEQDQMQEFISAAQTNEVKFEPVVSDQKPWESDRVRDDVIKMVSLRLPEPYIIKLQYLSEKTNLSQQEILRRVVLPWIDQEIEKY